MRRHSLILVTLMSSLTLAAAAQTQTAPAAQAQRKSSTTRAIPPGEADAAAALAASPRHGEYVDVSLPGSDQKIKTWVVYPERSEKAPIVLVVHEIFGLSDWVRSVADQLAADGFIALAPDLLSGKGPSGGGTAAVASRDEVTKLVMGLAPDEVNARLDAVRAYGIRLPAASGKSAVIGFCWGGKVGFAYPAARQELGAAVVYYGTSPDSAAVFDAIKTPILGLYGADDARVTATIEPAVKEMSRLGKVYEREIYEGAGHGFLRAQDGRDGANLRAAERAWPRMLAFLRQHTK